MIHCPIYTGQMNRHNKLRAMPQFYERSVWRVLFVQIKIYF